MDVGRRETNIKELEAEREQLLDVIEDSARETDDASIADGHDESTRIAVVFDRAPSRPNRADRHFECGQGEK